METLRFRFPSFDCYLERRWWERPANGGSSGVGQPLVLVGMRLKSVTKSRAERSIADRAANLKQEIGTSSGPAHLLRLVHSPIDEKVCGSALLVRVSMQGLPIKGRL